MTILWSGLGLGAVYALVAVLFNVVMTSVDVFNFAQPQFVMLGAFVGYWGLGPEHIPLVLVLLGGAVVGAAVGLVEERVAIRPLKSLHGHATLVTTVGAAVLIQGGALVIWGSTPKRVDFPLGDTTVSLLGGRVSAIDLILIGLAIGLGVAMELVVRRTRWGLACRAATADPDAARLHGIDLGRLSTVAFVVAGALSVPLGTVIGARMTANTDLGNNLVILGFVALAVGGFGTYVGAVVGGLAIGVIQLVTSRHLGSEYELIVLFGLLLVVLLTRPSGLLGSRTLRAV